MNRRVCIWDSWRSRKHTIYVRWDFGVTVNLVWMHVLKVGNVVDEIAEFFVDLRVLREIMIQHTTAYRNIICQALLVMKEET